MRAFSFGVCALVFIAVGADAAEAYDFSTMNYQGVLREADTNVTGTYTVTFSIWDSKSGGTKWWEETLTFYVVEGLIDTVLGHTNPLNTLDWTKRYWLQLQVLGDVAMPRIE